ncbi:hypothetical protein KY285_008720 [Solanum tuberosum]|nr:hypothetical protein KY285_008720 [Solanum tuberosum]
MKRTILKALPVRCLLKYPIEKLTWTVNIQYQMPPRCSRKSLIIVALRCHLVGSNNEATDSSLGEFLSIPLSGSTAYSLVNHGNISFGKKETDGKEEWNEIKDIAASIWHLCKLLLLNMTKLSYVAANSASTSLDDIIRCIALLKTSHSSIRICLVYPQLSNNETTMSIVLQVANEFASLLLTNLTIRGDAHAYSNLEDKVLIGVGSIVMNGPRPVLAKMPNTELSGYCGSGLINRIF